MSGVVLTNHFRCIHGNHGARTPARGRLLETNHRIAGVG
jgi:hypothetical protein